MRLRSIKDATQKYPIRLITIDALDKYHAWYKKIGFMDFYDRSQDGIWPMYFDCYKKSNYIKLEEYSNV